MFSSYGREPRATGLTRIRDGASDEEVLVAGEVARADAGNPQRIGHRVQGGKGGSVPVAAGADLLSGFVVQSREGCVERCSELLHRSVADAFGNRFTGGSDCGHGGVRV